MSDNGYITPDELLMLSRKDITTTGGRKYRIRRIGPSELFEIGFSPDLASYWERHRNSQDNQPDQQLAAKTNQLIARVIQRGITSLKVVVGLDEINGDAVRVSDIPDEDQTELFTAILGFAGLTEREADRVRPT